MPRRVLFGIDRTIHIAKRVLFVKTIPISVEKISLWYAHFHASADYGVKSPESISWKRHLIGKKRSKPSNFPTELFTLMVVLGRSVAGVTGYSSDKEGAKDAPSFLSTLFHKYDYVNCLEEILRRLAPQNDTISACHSERSEESPCSVKKIRYRNYEKDHLVMVIFQFPTTMQHFNA